MYEYEVEGAKPRGRPKKTWTEIVEKTVKGGCHGSQQMEEADRDDHDKCEWMNVSSSTGSPGLSRTKSREP